SRTRESAARQRSTRSRPPDPAGRSRRSTSKPGRPNRRKTAGARSAGVAALGGLRALGKRVKAGGSAPDQSAIDIIGLPGDVARAGRCEEHRHRRNILRLIGAADWYPRLLLGLHFSEGDAALVSPLDGIARSELGARHPRGDRIDIDVVA